MSVPTSHRRKYRLTRLQKVTAATGVAAVGAGALAFGVSANGSEGKIATAGSEIQAKSVAWQDALDAPAGQKTAIDAQTSRADEQVQAEADAKEKAEAQRKAAAAKAEAERRAEAARKAAAEKRQAAREKAEQE